jgi:hypothetical protein
LHMLRPVVRRLVQSRIQNALKEYKALRAADNPSHTYITDAAEFQEVKERLRESLQKTEIEIQEEKNRPSLKTYEPAPEECEEILKGTPSAAVPCARALVPDSGALREDAAQQRMADLEGPRSFPPYVD